MAATDLEVAADARVAERRAAGGRVEGVVDDRSCRDAGGDGGDDGSRREGGG